MFCGISSRQSYLEGNIPCLPQLPRSDKGLRIPVNAATHSTGMLPPKPVKAATLSERSDAGGFIFTLSR
jgi:hypothetical protein